MATASNKSSGGGFINVPPPRLCCAHCQTDDPKFRCSKCKQVAYCSKDCQRAHHQMHRPMCLLLSNQIDSDKALKLQYEMLQARFMALTTRAPFISMVVAALCERCKKHEVAKHMIPVVCIGPREASISIRLAPRVAIYQNTVSAFEETLALPHSFGCVLEVYPWTAIAAHRFVACSFEVTLTDEEAATPSGKSTIKALRDADNAAELLLLTAKQHADTLVYDLEYDNAKGMCLCGPVVLLRKQAENLFVPKELQAREKALTAQGAAELQHPIFSKLQDTATTPPPKLVV